MRTHFDSVKSYFEFAGAREFRFHDSLKKFTYNKTFLERVGDKLTGPIFGFSDAIIKNIRNPIVILAVTVACVALATILFYPTQFVAAVGFVLPQIFAIKPWMIKLGLYGITQVTLLGAGLRAYGRLQNENLVSAWNAKSIMPIAIGTQIEKYANKS